MTPPRRRTRDRLAPVACWPRVRRRQAVAGAAGPSTPTDRGTNSRSAAMLVDAVAPDVRPGVQRSALARARRAEQLLVAELALAARRHRRSGAYSGAYPVHRLALSTRAQIAVRRISPADQSNGNVPPGSTGSHGWPGTPPGLALTVPFKRRSEDR
jgi:hypothetical protein